MASWIQWSTRAYPTDNALRTNRPAAGGRTAGIPDWANDPFRYSHFLNGCLTVWCLDRHQTCWWYENDSNWTYQLCELPVAAPTAGALPQLAQPVLQHSAPAIGAAIADAEVAALMSQQAAEARAHAEDMFVQAIAADIWA